MPDNRGSTVLYSPSGLLILYIPPQVLSPYFGGILGFVKENEPLLERGEKDRIKVDEKRVQQLVRGFSNDWKRSIEDLNQDIMHSFSNFKNGTAILQVRPVESDSNN